MQNKIRILILLLFLNNFFYGKTKDDVNVKKVYTTVKIDNANVPIIDGLINESIWDTVVWGGDFTRRQEDLAISKNTVLLKKFEIGANASSIR